MILMLVTLCALASASCSTTVETTAVPALSSYDEPQPESKPAELIPPIDSVMECAEDSELDPLSSTAASNSWYENHAFLAWVERIITLFLGAIGLSAVQFASKTGHDKRVAKRVAKKVAKTAASKDEQ